MHGRKSGKKTKRKKKRREEGKLRGEKEIIEKRWTWSP